ncbi:MAG: 6-phosphogluconolactonase [Puniceicoccales bacterium]|jgi:6-phosphogluconolactonase|nr:6-phosphogluconolactonase [Puniceicoccales bacterium]
MNPIKTLAGEVHVLEHHAAFAKLAQIINDTGKQVGASVALSGGSTPMAFYKWAIEYKAIHAHATNGIHWYVSDERCVPLTSLDSNFGNAERQFLQPLAIPLSHRHPWQIDSFPAEAAAHFSAECAARLADGKKLFDLCVLGLGDDAHTASLWPGCPLINASHLELAMATEWPKRGWRLTITQRGLAECGKIVVMAFGAGKAKALYEALLGQPDPAKFPAQVLRPLAKKVIWLADEAAAALLANG